MHCIEDPKPALLRGQYTNADGVFLKVSWKECVPPPKVQWEIQEPSNCKSPEEIKQFLSETHLVHFHNSQVYEPTKYSDDVVYNSLRIENFNFNRLVNIFNVNKNTLTDQRSLYSIGFNSLNVEFYTVEQTTKDFADEGVISEFIY